MLHFNQMIFLIGRRVIMSSRPKGPKQKKNPDLPKSPAQPYGEPLEGSKKVKKANHSGQNHNPHHGL